MFLDINDPDGIDKRLSAYGEDKDIDYIVVSDGEGILGIGDQGVGAIRIAIAKLGLMTLCGGIHPARVLPIALDVGTNNDRLLNDELYMGNKFPRVRDEKYWDFVDKVIQAIKKDSPVQFCIMKILVCQLVETCYTSTEKNCLPLTMIFKEPGCGYGINHCCIEIFKT